MSARLVLVFPSGDSLGIPMTMVDELHAPTPRELSMLELSPDGDTIISEAVDAHISVAALVRDYADQQTSFMERVVRVSSGAMGRRKSARKSLAAAGTVKKTGGRESKMRWLRLRRGFTPRIDKTAARARPRRTDHWHENKKAPIRIRRFFGHGRKSNLPGSSLHDSPDLQA